MSLTMSIPGTQTPNGIVCVSGAKNSATRLMAAALLTDEKVRLKNFPTELLDARKKAECSCDNGADIHFDSDNDELNIVAKNYASQELTHYDYPFRTTYLLVAGQILRNGIARIPYPGGCRLGDRKHDLHIMVWEKFGATISEHNTHIEIRCSGFQGAQILFPFQTIGGTENAILCAAIASGTTTIENAYLSPEVEDMISLLKTMGADITSVGKSKLVISGTPTTLSGTSYSVMSDRIEALTWLTYGVLTGGRIHIRNVPFAAMAIPLIHIRDAGIDFLQNTNEILITPDCYPDGVQPFQVACGTHPGIISDMQPFFVLLALAAQGNSLIVDYRYPQRTAFLAELSKLLSSNTLEWNNYGHIKASGPATFNGGTDINSTDLRGSMAAVLGALASKQPTTVRNVDMALRGYNKLAQKLTDLGVLFKLTEQQ